jgi:ankyrin repeat protein
MTALMFAADYGHMNIVTFLIQNGADVNIQVSVCLNRICFSNMPIHHVIFITNTKLIAIIGCKLITIRRIVYVLSIIHTELSSDLLPFT